MSNAISHEQRVVFVALLALVMGVVVALGTVLVSFTALIVSGIAAAYLTVGLVEEEQGEEEEKKSFWHCY